jgi:DNA-binding response OmpR family regulator
VSTTILIVEDDAVARQVVQRALRQAGFEVVIAPDALAAVSQARTKRPDLIVLDLGLPAGGGFSVMQRIRVLPELSTTPILVVSGLDRAQNEARALDAGASGYLQKPVTPEQIVAAIRTVLSGAPLSPL